jgi:CxxC motif-containing protein (DUF1111 family)
MKEKQQFVRGIIEKLKSSAVTALSLALLMAGVTLAVASDQTGQSRPGSQLAWQDQLAPSTTAPQEAPAGFDGNSNDPNLQQVHLEDQAAFDEVEGISDGLGPVYNAQSCRECHQSPVSGGISQVTELRVGRVNRFGQFQALDVPIADGTAVIPSRSLINDRAICPSGDFPNTEVQERVPGNANVRTLRTSLNVLGDGFVEAIPGSTIQQIAAKQCRETNGQICGQAIFVPVSEAPGQMRIARFGWKNQHASLLSFSADAYLNEMGITSRLQPVDTTTVCKTTQDPENNADPVDGLGDIDRFARFMRLSKAPARDETLAATIDAKQGADAFDRIGCDTCHVSSIVTAPTGSVINGGSFVVPDALGNKTIHPFSDFLLHNVGTGDGIVQNGGAQTANKLRTPPLWGVRLRDRMMHDGLSLTFEEAILRHSGEAFGVVRNFRNLTEQERDRLVTFLKSL